MKAQLEFDIDMSHSFLVGDKLTDILAARDAQVAQALLVRSGQSITPEDEGQADAVLNDLNELPQWIKQAY